MILFSGHARDKIIERGIEVDDVLVILSSGEVIKSYPDDKPYPSKLILGFIGSAQQALHIVAAEDATSGTIFIITAYYPDPARWTPDFKTKIP